MRNSATLTAADSFQWWPLRGVFPCRSLLTSLAPLVSRKPIVRTVTDQLQQLSTTAQETKTAIDPSSALKVARQ
jgi:hypothetical protein